MEKDIKSNDEYKEQHHKSSKATKFAIRTIKFLKNECTEGEVFSYIDSLHDQLKKRQKKIKKYKEKIKKLTKKVKKLEVKKDDSEEKKASKVPTEDEDDKTEALESKPQLSLVEEIREAAEAAQNEIGFVYEPTSGLYYDQRTGYYYNAEYGLYYDGNTGCYYKYDQDNNKFEFHSQVEAQPTEADKTYDNNENNYPRHERSSKRKESIKKSRKRKRQSESDDDIKEDDERSGERLLTEREDGELNSSTSDSSDSIEELQQNGHYQDIARKYPPSLRVIVQETNLEKLQVGSLHLITFKGGTLGREGTHDVIIPDVNISKFHLKFSYDEEKEVYTCTDLGSRNGTVLNGKRMSASQQESDPINLVHGSVIQLSQTKLLCHVHPGNSTCGQCEPGLLIESKDDPSKIVALSHKQQLKKLQKKYGLENEKFIESRKTAGYNDRAATRRVEVGSSTDKEKTEMASIDTEIPSQNKGFMMLSKLGWNKGEALGKSNASGILEPISVVSNAGTKGLGCDEPILPTVALSKQSKIKIETWQKARERYDKVSQSNMFSSSDDEDLVP